MKEKENEMKKNKFFLVFLCTYLFYVTPKFLSLRFLKRNSLLSPFLMAENHAVYRIKWVFTMSLDFFSPPKRFLNPARAFPSRRTPVWA
jgi:hypothetical protein